ncbi:MAG TPA: ribonuclease H-like domain-containing protein [Bacillota bacterium]
MTGCSEEKTGTSWEEQENKYGRYYRIQEECSTGIVLEYPGPDLIQQHLSLIYGIGPKTAASLRENGFETLEQLCVHPKWGRAAQEICDLIRRKKLDRLLRYGAKEEELVGFFPRSDLVFLDLETLGLSAVHPIFLIGVFYFDGPTPLIQQLLAGDYEGEKAILHAARTLFSRFQVVVSYNGRSFDLPYLKRRMQYHGLEWSGFPHQLDLFRQTRRYFKGQLPDYRLTTAGSHLLAKVREDTISGREAPEKYHSFVQTGDTRLLQEILLHNKEDLLTMAGLVKVISRRAQEKGKELGLDVG